MIDKADAKGPSRRRLLWTAISSVAAGVAAMTASSVFSGSTTYQYDVLGRVIQANYADGTQITYAYDPAGNRIQVSKTAGSGSSSSSSSSSASGGTLIQVTSASNLRTLANNSGYTGAAPGNYQFNVASGVTVIGAAAGGRGIDTGTWPAGSSILLTVSGNVYGGGGGGGGGSATGAGTAGSAGGDAIYVQAPITVTVNSGGSVQAGGGGGGGGGYAGGTVGGDGGGGGFPNGAGGAGSSGTVHDAAVAGSSGTMAGGGAGGASGPPGGTGGNAGTAGAAGTTSAGAGGTGGAAGYAIRKNGNALTLTNNGTVTGTVG